MPRTIFFICSGVCLLNATATIAQHLSRNPNPQQIIGFRMQEQQNWNIKQLPKNSVLYKSVNSYAAWQASIIPYKRQQPVFLLPSFTPVNQQWPGLINYQQPPPFTSLQSFLYNQRMKQNQWNKQSWWRDPLQAPGSGILRGIIQNNKYQPL